MKSLIFYLVFFSTFLAVAHPPPPPAASTNDVNTGTDGFKYVSPKTMKHHVATEIAANLGGTTVTNLSHTNLISYTNFWAMDEWGGVADADGTMQSVFQRVHASGGSDLGGTIWFSARPATFDNTVSLFSGASSGINSAQFGYGKFVIDGDRKARLTMSGGTNLLLVTGNNFRHVTVRNLTFDGTNVTRSPQGRQVGLMFYGPSGQADVENCTFTEFDVGLGLHDVTGFEARNIICVSNFIGAATGYKPDGVKFSNSRFDRGTYGFWTHWTNNHATTVSAFVGKPVLDNCVFGLNAKAAIVHPKGSLSIRNGYGEANGPDNHSLVFLQLGWDLSDSYEQTFTNNWGNMPEVDIEGIDFNFKHGIVAWRQSLVRISGFNEVSNARPYIVLKNADADNSTILPDRLIVVTNSSGTQMIVPTGYAFISNVVVRWNGVPTLNEVLVAGSDGGNENIGGIDTIAASTFEGSGGNLTNLNAGYVASGTLALARGGTGSSLSDPNANRLLGWDDTDGAVKFWTLGSGLSYDVGTDTITSSGGSETLWTTNRAGDELILASPTDTVSNMHITGLILGRTNGGANTGYIYYADRTTKAVELDQSLGTGITIKDDAGVDGLHVSVASRRLVDKDNVDVLTFTDDTTAAFNVDVRVPDEAYDATAWNGSLEVPTKNALRDAVEAHGIDDVLTRGSDANGQSLTNVNNLSVTNLNAVTITVNNSVQYRQITGATNLVVTGDSKDTTFGGGNVTWATILTNLDFTYRIITNSAVSGQKVATILANYGNYIEPWQPGSTSNAWLVNFGGINDIFYGTNAYQLIALQSNLSTLARSNGYFVALATLPAASTVTNHLENQRLIYNGMLRTNRFYDVLFDADLVIPHAVPFFTNDMIHYHVAGKTNVALGTLGTLKGGRWNPMPVIPNAFPNVGPHVFSGGLDTNTFRGIAHNVLFRGPNPLSIGYHNDTSGEYLLQNSGGGFYNWYGLASGDSSVDFPADCFMRWDLANSYFITPRSMMATNGYRTDMTITAGGTTGNRTINKTAGTVNFAAAATAITVTCSFATTSSLIFATVRTDDSTATIKNVVPGSGSFTINLTAAATAETSVGWWILNP